MAGSHDQYPSTAYTLSLLAGVLIIVSGSLATLLAYTWVSTWDGTVPPLIERVPSNATIPHWREAMPPNVIAFGRMVFVAMAALGLVSGIVVLIAAILLRSRPREHTTWGALILVFSILSFPGMGGFFIGAIIGIVGGALALSWKQG